MSPPETNRSAPPHPLPHDAAYKSTFAHALAVEHLMRGFVANLVEHAPAWFATLDFDTLEPLPTENIGSFTPGSRGTRLPFASYISVRLP